MFVQKLSTYYSKNRQRNGSKVQSALYDKIMSGGTRCVSISEQPAILDSIKKANSFNRIDEIFELIILAILTAVSLVSIVNDIMTGSLPHVIPIGFLTVFTALTLMLLIRHFKIKKRENEIYRLAENGNFCIFQYRVNGKETYNDCDSGDKYFLALNDFSVEVSPEIYEHINKGYIVSVALIMYKNNEFLYIII